MGIKHLWSVLTPYAERKPICELRGKTVAIDLAGWVCESLNVVDYFVHPRHHLKNLFFRACYLIWEEVTPVFVLEGVAPKLKSQVIEKRNEVQFRGVKPKDTQSHSNYLKPKGDKGRTRFNHVLKQCENLLQAMGFQCVQGPGEAEAYCAFLNSKGLVDGVISQDSDCFAYGALRVYRNFSVSSQGALAAQGGAVDIYDMNTICSKIENTVKKHPNNKRDLYLDFGQNKVVVMALLCGCDYCPDGIGGVGRDSVLKLFKKYSNNEILKRIRSWRLEDDKYSALEIRVDDKTICSNCGHIGRIQSHTKNGCGICRTIHGCDENLWKEDRILLKTELTLRKKALADPSFPSEEIIDEFLNQPKEVPNVKLNWGQPNLVKFIKQVGHLLQWPEIYCFQKFFPILTRWYILKVPLLKDLSAAANYVSPKEIIKKRVVKGVPSLELLWEDKTGVFNGLIPDDQLKEFLDNNPKGLQDIWSTVEPFEKVKMAYPSLVESFLKPKEKTKKSTRNRVKLSKELPMGSLECLNNLVEATNDIVISLNTKRQTKNCNIKPRSQIYRFFKQNYNNSIEGNNLQSSSKHAYNFNIATEKCSTPITKTTPSDLESDVDNDAFDMSEIVKEIVGKSHKSFALTSLKGKQLYYESSSQDIRVLLNETLANDRNKSVDDFYIPNSKKRSISNSPCKSSYKEAKRHSLDDSFDVLVKKGNCRSLKFNEVNGGVSNFVDRFKQKHVNRSRISRSPSEEDNYEDEKDVSYFFNSSFSQDKQDAFERLMETSIGKKQNFNKMDNDFLMLSD